MKYTRRQESYWKGRGSAELLGHVINKTKEIYEGCTRYIGFDDACCEQ